MGSQDAASAHSGSGSGVPRTVAQAMTYGTIRPAAAQYAALKPNSDSERKPGSVYGMRRSLSSSRLLGMLGCVG